MRICVISTNIIVCPPPGYSGIEYLTWQQAKGLAAKGHTVSLVCPNGSLMPPGVEQIPTGLGEPENVSYERYWQRLFQFDAVIDHSWQKWSNVLRMEGKLKAPVLNVMHVPIHSCDWEPPPADKVPFPNIVAISNDHGNAVTELFKTAVRVAYDGLDPDFYKPTKQPRNGRYLFLARFSTIKGPHIAIDVVNRVGGHMDMVGDDKITGEADLIARCKAQCEASKGRLRYIGPQSREQCVSWFNSNKALIHPVKGYREPFGMSPVEAQLCGTPVLAWDNGAMRETVKHGETGFIVKSEDEMANVLKSGMLSSIKPERCREWASQFSVQNFVNRYEELCQEAIEKGGW